MVAAYFWVLILLLLFPSVWFRSQVGLGTYTGGMVLKYVPGLQEKVESSRGKKDSLDQFIQEKKRRAPEEEFEERLKSPVEESGAQESGSQ